MNFAELPAYLEGLKARVEASAVPVVDAIAETYETHLVGFTLHESGSHAPVTRTPAPPGRPPAFMTGQLAGSVTRSPGVGGGGVADASVQPNTIYAGTQEYGGIHHGAPLMALWIRYIGYAEVKRRNWLRRTVTIPARPYMSTATAETIENGSLERAGMERFEAVVWGG